MIRPNVRLRGMALITMVALVPMIIVITTVSAMLIDRVLRVQREASYRVANVETATRLVDQLRIDAASASSVTLNEQANRLVFTTAENDATVEYTLDDGVVVRNDSDPNAPIFPAWSFVHANVQLSLEESSATAPLIWLRVEYEVELRKKVIQVAEMTTAIHVGNREAQP
ncbi:MAG: hypothetical protein DHS20C16_31780 [Phycisphaerae bacterium]|nr:MAG: hypothetical protein DHS20C16_31780 [Phycisphaerae bacterium]